MFSLLDYLVALLAACAAGTVNAVAGGGTLITFPILTAIGLPAVVANLTNTVALCPGFFGAAVAQRNDLVGQERRLSLIVPTSAIGGVAGAFLLLWSGERVFQAIVPFLILAAAGLLAGQEVLGRWLAPRQAPQRLAGGLYRRDPTWVESLLVGLIGTAAVYGGYFGAGLGVILLGILGSLLPDAFTRLNALKHMIALTVNVSAAIFFLLSGQVVWQLALVMAVGAIVGGTFGGRYASRANPRILRRIVIAIGVVVGIVYLVR